MKKLVFIKVTVRKKHKKKIKIKKNLHLKKNLNAS